MTPLEDVEEGATVIISNRKVVISSVGPSPRNRNFWTVFGTDEDGVHRSITNDIRKGTKVEVVTS